MQKKALIIAGEEFEDIELLYPLYRLKEEGWEVHIASYKDSLTGKKGYKVKVDIQIKDVDPDNYDVLIIPGGRGPERVRVFAGEDAVRIIRAFFESKKPIIAICHGPQLLLSAGIVRGIRMTSYWGIKDDLVAAGAKWIDREVVIHGQIVTSRIPSDIPAWFREAIKLLREKT